MCHSKTYWTILSIAHKLLPFKNFLTVPAVYDGCKKKRDEQRKRKGKGGEEVRTGLTVRYDCGMIPTFPLLRRTSHQSLLRIQSEKKTTIAKNNGTSYVVTWISIRA
jgi:hypothetical protein